MRLAFCCQHPYWGGLSPGGGSRTIVMSAKTLREMGHEVCIVTQSDKYKWDKHPKPLKHIPADTDVCIACSVSDIDPMLKKMPSSAKPFWWCRLIENHQMPKAKIIKRAGMVRTLVNSEGLQSWFKRHDVETTVAYQGVDVEAWQDEIVRSGKKIVGFLVSSKERKHFDMVEKIVKKCGDEYDYVGYGAGVDQSGRTAGFAGRNFIYFKTDPKHTDLVRLYNLCYTWVATSTKEGLHNCPIEAALCGCAVVYPDAPLAGCGDHCIDGETAWEYESLNAESARDAIQKADRSRIEAHKTLIRFKIGDRKQAMTHLLEVLNAD